MAVGQSDGPIRWDVPQGIRLGSGGVGERSHCRLYPGAGGQGPDFTLAHPLSPNRSRAGLTQTADASRAHVRCIYIWRGCKQNRCVFHVGRATDEQDLFIVS